MKFTTNLKPLNDALALGVINANVSNYNKRSNVAQLTVSGPILRINLESSMIKTEVTMRGSNDTSESSTIFVSSVLLKSLVSTLEGDSVVLEFAQGGLILHCGKSKFNLPKILDESDIELDRPISIDAYSEPIEIKPDDWKFIKDNQMYAIALTFVHPVYTYVWVNEHDDVLVGSTTTSLFTSSRKQTLKNTCLLSDTIINLFTSLPDGSKLYKCDKEYVIGFTSDSLTYRTQFTPMYESDDGVGSYNADFLLPMLEHREDCSIVDANSLFKFLNQAQLFDSDKSSINWIQSNGQITLKDRNIECNVNTEGVNFDYEIEFDSSVLRKVISSYKDTKINFVPVFEDGVATSLVFWSDDLTTVLAGVA